jgi:type VI secretion system secreted protein VgrG
MNLTASMSIGVDLGGPSSTDRPYTLSVGPYRSGQLTVDSFQGREEISALYSFDLVLTGTGTDDDLEHTALGQRAVLTMRVGKVPRVFHGIVTEVRMEGRRAEHHASRYRMKLAPRAWLLKRRKGSRIFQRLRVDQVIDAVLDGAGIGRRWQLSREYPAREYCTQYEESDYRFITRILAESGIFFYFEQGSSLLDGAIGAAAGAAGGAIAGAAGGAIGAIAGAAAAILSGETIVFCDDPALYPPIDDGSAASAVGAAAAAAGIPTGASIQIGSMSASAALESPTLYHRGTDGMVTPTEDRVTSFVSCRSVRSSSAVYQEYDPERPQANLIASSSSLGAAAAGVAAAIRLA